MRSLACRSHFSRPIAAYLSKQLSRFLSHQFGLHLTDVYRIQKNSLYLYQAKIRCSCFSIRVNERTRHEYSLDFSLIPRTESSTAVLHELVHRTRTRALRRGLSCFSPQPRVLAPPIKPDDQTRSLRQSRSTGASSQSNIHPRVFRGSHHECRPRTTRR